MIKQEPLITVIMPAYNVEKFLERSVNSVINQDYHNLDILIIDDGSRDKTPEIADMLKEKDTRVRVIHQLRTHFTIYIIIRVDEHYVVA